jgi:hypothetical protein
MKYIIEGHALRRIIQRKIPREWIEITIEHGDKKRNYGSKNLTLMSISKDKCQELINDIFDIKYRSNINFEERKKLNKRMKSLKELRNRGGIKVVYDHKTNKIVTTYHKKETITAEFRVF